MKGKSPLNSYFPTIEESWIRIRWKDSNGKIWEDNIPLKRYKEFKLFISKRYGTILKETK